MSPRRRCAPFSFPQTRNKKPRPDYGKVLDFQCGALHIPIAIPEYRFHPIRRWRFDRAWVDHKVAVEIEGGAFSDGAHVRGAHFRSDIEKYAEALMLGWRVLRVMPEHVTNGRAIQWVVTLVASKSS